MAFTSKDLALLLPDEVDSFSMRHSNVDEQQDTFVAPKPKVDATKRVTRYFPGRAPDWVDPSELSKEKPMPSTQAPKAEVTDRRLARLAKASAASSTSSTGRRRYEAMVIEDPNELLPEDVSTPKDTLEDLQVNEVNDQDDIAARRQRIKERLAAAAAEEKLTESAETHPQESESEYETDSSEEESSEEEEKVLMRPVFIPRSKRQTIVDKELLQEKEELKAEEAKLLVEERKRATHTLVAESVRRLDEMDQLSQQAVTDIDSDAGLPDDHDDENDESAYEEWKIREMSRIKRDSEFRIQDALEKAELERRRNMTADERYAEDVKSGRFDKKEKEKWSYLQKYYHKGAFYMDEGSIQKDDVRKKDYYEPTLEDNFNKEALPAVMQVKNFGKRGRTKYTHLLDQDTTQSQSKDPAAHKDTHFLSGNKSIMNKYMNKRAGIGDMDKPFSKRSRNS